MTFKQGSPETKRHDNPEIKSNDNPETKSNDNPEAEPHGNPEIRSHDSPEKMKQPYTRKHNNGHMLTAVLHQTGREQYIMAGRR